MDELEHACEILGVPLRLAPDERRTRARTAAAAAHPDRGGDAVEFARRWAAYQVVRDAYGADPAAPPPCLRRARYTQVAGLDLREPLPGPARPWRTPSTEATPFARVLARHMNRASRNSSPAGSRP